MSKIFVLTQSHDGCNNSYLLNTFKTRFEAIEYITNSGYYPSDYRFFEGNELRLSLTEVEDE